MAILDFDELCITRETAELRQGGQYANLELVVLTTPNSDLLQAWGPAEDISYSAGVNFTFTVQQQILQPMVTRFYPGYQETIYGQEGIVLSKRVFVPYRAGYQRSVCWLLEVQAEGAQLIRLDIDLHWPAEQNVVQREQRGLILAQVDPKAPRHGTEERQAWATTVFGTDGGPPSAIEFPSPQRARLTYYVLVEGYVDLPFVAAFSDAGEVMAWNGFLANQDITHLWNDSNEQLSSVLQSSRVYTPDAAVNRKQTWFATHLLRSARRHRQGPAPGHGVVQHLEVHSVLNTLTAFDYLMPHFSAGVLQMLGRRAIVGDRIAATLDGFGGEGLVSADDDLKLALSFLQACHHRRALTGELARRHLAAPIRTLGPRIVRQANRVSAETRRCVEALLAFLNEDEAAEATGQRAGHSASGDVAREKWESLSHWLASEAPPWMWPEASDLERIARSARYLWEHVAGLQLTAAGLEIHPHLPSSWSWLVLSNIPWQHQNLPLIFYQGEIHTDRLIPSAWPVSVWDKVSPLKGPPSAWHLQRADAEALFVASDHAWEDNVKVGDEKYPVKLRPGEAHWLDL